jgi:hypothetical protein
MHALGGRSRSGRLGALSVRGIRIGLAVLVPVGFLASCAALIPVATHLTDSMTLAPVDQAYPFPFPILVVRGTEASVEEVDHPRDVPPPPPGASYLVPTGRVEAVERYLREHDTTHHKSSWVLRVASISSDRQRIELFLLGDGYWGGVYEATATSITPLYRRITGPGYALVFGPLALGLNVMLWGVFATGIWAIRRYRRAAQLLHAADGGPVG